MATKNYMQLNISNPMLNLTKNTYQNADFTKLESYPYDNMLQPINTYQINSKEHYKLNNTIWHIKNKNEIWRDSTLIDDLSNAKKVSTTESEGKRLGFYYIDLSNTLYFSTTKKRTFSSNYQIYVDKDTALVIDDKLYYYNNVGDETSYSIPSGFDFNNCIAFGDIDNSLMLVQKKLYLTGLLTYVPQITYLYKGQIKTTQLANTTIITSSSTDISGNASTKVLATANFTDFTISGETPVVGVAEKDGDNLRVAILPTLNNSKPLNWVTGNIMSNPGTSNIYWVRYQVYKPSSIGFTHIDDKLESLYFITKNIMENPPSISNTNSKVYLNTTNAVVIAGVFQINDSSNNKVMFLKELSTGNGLTACTTTQYIGGGNNLKGFILRNSSGYALVEKKKIDDHFSLYYKEGALMYILYDDMPLNLSYTIDDYYIASNYVDLYSSTNNKSYRVIISANNPLKVFQIGEELYTNALIDYKYNKYGKVSKAISFPYFEAKSNNYIVSNLGYTIDDNSPMKSSYMAFEVNDAYLQAGNFYSPLIDSSSSTADNYNYQIQSQFNVYGSFNMFVGDVGTVGYISTWNNNIYFIRNIEKEYGVSETSLYELPVTDFNHILTNYDIYNTYVSIQGYTIKLSVLYNKILNVYSTSSIDDEIDDIFIIQGQSYMIKNDAIYSFNTNSENGISDEQFIVSVEGLKYLGYETTQAYLFDPLTKNVLIFVGSNQLSNNLSLSGLSFNKEIFSWQDVEHQLFILTTDTNTLLSICNNIITLPFRIDGNCVVHSNKIYLGNQVLTLGTGTNHITTGWISLNSNAESPFNKFGAVYVDLLKEGNTTITVSVLTPDREVKTDAVKTFNNTKYIKFVPDTVTGLKIKLDITTNQSIVGISLSADEITSQSNTIRSNLI